MATYEGGWSSYEDMTDHENWVNWKGSEAVKENEVIYAVYNQESYEGSAFILFEREGKLFEASESHCSCNGLENFEPEETSWEALAMRPRYRQSEFLGKLIEQHTLKAKLYKKDGD